MNYVNTEHELAKAFGVSRGTISRWKRIPECPGKNSDGKYDLRAWETFVLNEPTIQSVKGPITTEGEQGEEPTRRYGRIKNETELCDFLGVSRSTVSRLKRRDGAPKTRPDGTYPAQEWKEFYEKNAGKYSLDDDELALERRAKRQIAEIKMEREMLELETERGNLISIDECCRVLTEAFGGAVQAFRDSEHSIAPLVAGLDVPAARSVIRKSNIDALMKFSLGEWAKKKAFWRIVYAKLRDLRETLSRGNGQSVM